VRFALTLAGLNAFDVKMADIENAYLTALITEKAWTVLSGIYGNHSRPMPTNRVRLLL
jgi:hypothetical protein